MCDCCHQPKKCEKGKDPEECTPEQIEECHGEDTGHSCVQEPAKAK